MKERPILFSGAMIRAILAGQKTQTRRVMKNPPTPSAHFPWLGVKSLRGTHSFVYPNALPEILAECPYGQPGDRLWVRESWRTDSTLDAKPPSSFKAWPIRYVADGKIIKHGSFFGNTDGKTRPGIHMPRWASRILLEVVSVRVERLQSISEADAEAEGCERLDSERDEHDWKICPQCGGTRLHSAMGGGGGVIFDCDCRECDTYVKRYRHLWESINGADSWAANPWVWVVEFKRVEGQPL